MVTIRLCLIVKKEETTLPRCLESVQGLAEEVVIVDCLLYTSICV